MTSAPDDGSEEENRLLELFEQLMDDSRSNSSPDWAKLQTQHPDLIADLRELYATAMIAEDFADLSKLDPIEPGSGSAGSSPFNQIIAGPDGVGSRIGDYELLEEIGRGGMGVVYRARQISLDRIVALKMLLRGSLASESDLARFKAEAEAAGRANHPNIIEIYEIGEYQEQPFFSMRFVDGETLSQRLQNGPIPARDAAEILLPIAQAVAAAHAKGVLHRDLKSSNILIDKSGMPFVTDFGLAKRVRTGDTGLDSITQSGAIIGTPAYMSPEQAAGQRAAIGPPSDVYSLGACLYAMLTGRPPFQAATQFDVMMLVLEQDPLPPRVVSPQADPDLEIIALKCLQKPIDLRYESADALANDLSAYLANEPISARSSHLSQIISRAFRETHHAQVLENWGLLWILHSMVLLVLCVVTNWFQLRNMESRWPYLGLWVIGLGMWAVVFWNLRRRSGPITFVERQIAHVWAGSMLTSTLLFAVEALMGLRVLALAPVLGLVSGMVFLVKAGILSGRFYIQAMLLFATSVAMAMIRHWKITDFSLTLFGVVSAACFLLPGLKYYRQQRVARRTTGS